VFLLYVIFLHPSVDPGLGKSQLLQAVTNVAPRGVYVCGSYSSSSGLTVTLHKEKGSGDYALEAGTFLLALVFLFVCYSF